jgi:putative polysaccharide biosynthesis protein
VGERGSLRVEIARGDGRLGRAVGLAPEGMGLTEVEIHPKTGVAFAGFRLPFWPQACGLVEEAASRLVPLQTLGWDVAFTPTGPVIIEANSAWGPPNGLGGMPLLLRMLRERALRTD